MPATKESRDTLAQSGYAEAVVLFNKLEKALNNGNVMHENGPSWFTCVHVGDIKHEYVHVQPQTFSTPKSIERRYHKPAIAFSLTDEFKKMFAAAKDALLVGDYSAINAASAFTSVPADTMIEASKYQIEMEASRA